MSGDFTFLKGNIETIILCSLYGGDKYGYEIAKEIKERTDNKYEIKQPTLYAYLKRLESQDFIFSYWGAESNGGRRRYYKLTELGKQNCDNFMSEWKYHRTVLDNLVDDGVADVEALQNDVTPLFGSKQKRVKKEKSSSALSEQALIFERLKALEKTSDEVESSSTATEAAVLQKQSDKSSIGQISSSDRDSSKTEDAAKVASYSVKQEDADVFLEKFERRARELTDREAMPSVSEGENYQHVLMNVLGDQLDEMASYKNKEEIKKTEYRYTNDRPIALEDVADSFAKQGIRMRIYNRTTAVYRSKTLMPLRKVVCLTSWFTFVAAIILLGLLAVLSYKQAGWAVYCITAGILALIPISFTILMVADPVRKNKPQFNFKTLMLVACASALLVTLLAFGINILAFNIKFSDFGAVSTQILIPTALSLLFPVAVVIYNAMHKKY